MTDDLLNYDILKKQLKELAEMDITLQNKGGPPEDGELFEKILHIQDAILGRFQLPVKSDFENILWFKTPPTDMELENRIKKLNQTAQNYLLSKSLPEIKILEDAQETKESPFNVLPELQIITHSYTIFVYNKILLLRKDTPENVLKDLKIANSDYNLDQLGRLASGILDNEVEVIQELKEKGIKYIDQFIYDNSHL